MMKLASAICGLVASFSVTTAVGQDAAVPTSERIASKKALSASVDAPDADLLGTLVQTHTGERVALDGSAPPAERFDALLADRVTGQRHEIDARLLDVLRRLARLHGVSRIEIVSGFRSEKLNETLRKKGHHVATHSQHSLGHAVDFRLVPASFGFEGPAVDPREIEREVRDMGWDGGVGVYLSEADWFTHVDVGPNRRWNGR